MLDLLQAVERVIAGIPTPVLHSVVARPLDVEGATRRIESLLDDREQFGWLEALGPRPTIVDVLSTLLALALSPVLMDAVVRLLPRLVGPTAAPSLVALPFSAGRSRERPLPSGRALLFDSGASAACSSSSWPSRRTATTEAIPRPLRWTSSCCPYPVTATSRTPAPHGSFRI